MPISVDSGKPGYKQLVFEKNEEIGQIEPGTICCFPYNFRPCEDEAVNRFMLQVIKILEEDF